MINTSRKLEIANEKSRPFVCNARVRVPARVCMCMHVSARVSRNI
jgi:hypothetical protein